MFSRILKLTTSELDKKWWAVGRRDIFLAINIKLIPRCQIRTKMKNLLDIKGNKWTSKYQNCCAVEIQPIHRIQGKIHKLPTTRLGLCFDLHKGKIDRAYCDRQKVIRLLFPEAIMKGTLREETRFEICKGHCDTVRRGSNNIAVDPQRHQDSHEEV